MTVKGIVWLFLGVVEVSLELRWSSRPISLLLLCVHTNNMCSSHTTHGPSIIFQPIDPLLAYRPKKQRPTSAHLEEAARRNDPQTCRAALDSSFICWYFFLMTFGPKTSSTYAGTHTSINTMSTAGDGGVSLYQVRAALGNR